MKSILFIYSFIYSQTITSIVEKSNFAVEKNVERKNKIYEGYNEVMNMLFKIMINLLQPSKIIWQNVF